MLLLVICIFILYAYDTNKKISKLQNENKELKKQLENYLKENVVEKKLESTQVTETHQPQQIQQAQQQPQQAQQTQEIQETQISKEELKARKEKQERESRNTGILVTGALLIVLSAIVFLTSTWYSIANIVKTMVILLLIGVFYGASNIAKNKLNLPKASKAFFYIAMAYIPICLISCSLFGLFGEFLSILGEGRYIYLTIVFIITAIVYIYNYLTKHDKVLLYGTILSQILAVILFTLIFSENILLICINILIYNCLLILFKEKLNTKTNWIRNICEGISYLVAIILVFSIQTVDFWLLILFPILAINFFLLRKENPVMISYSFNITLYLFGIYLFFTYLNISADYKIAMSLIYSIALFITIEILSSRSSDINIQNSSLIVNLLYIFIVYGQTISDDAVIMKSFIVSFLETIFAYIAYTRSKVNTVRKKFLAYLIPITIILSVNEILGKLDVNFCFYIIFAIILLKISNMQKMRANFNDIRKAFLVLSQIYITVLYVIAIFFYNDKTLHILIAFILSAYLLFNNIKYRENKFLKIIPATGLLMMLSRNIDKGSINSSSALYATLLLILTTIALTIISIYKNKISIETIFSFIYLLSTLKYFDSIYAKEIFFIIWSLANLCFMSSNKEKDLFKGLLYCGGLLLYCSIIDSLNLEYNSPIIIGITIFTVLLFRTIIQKYIQSDLDIFEGIVLGIIYLSSMITYLNEFDGMIYVMFIVLLVIFSYVKKYGTLCMVSILAIIVNVLALTREFWFSIPWWIYLLVIGAILIGFAMKNESNENKLNIGETIKRIKEKIEK